MGESRIRSRISACYIGDEIFIPIIYVTYEYVLENIFYFYDDLFFRRDKKMNYRNSIQGADVLYPVYIICSFQVAISSQCFNEEQAMFLVTMRP